MTKKKKSRLGKGLGALLGDVKQTTSQPAAVVPNEAPPEATPSQADGFKELPIEWLQRGRYQPRINMDKASIEELADSIRAQGIIQPLLVRRIEQDRYEIIAGERRWRGAQLAGLTAVPAVVREMDDQTAMAIGLIENIQRQDLNAIEEAQGLQRLLDEFGLTHEEVAESVGRSRTAVTNSLRLLNLDDKVRAMVQQNQLGMGHARALLGLETGRQLEAAKKVAAGGLSVRATEHLVKRLSRGLGGGRKKPAGNEDVKRLEDDLSEKIGAKVEIQHSNKGGKLVIHYYSLDELDGILQKIH